MSEKPASESVSEKDLIESAIQFAYQLTRNRNDSEDLAQQAWMKVQRKYGSVPNRSLLFVAVRNTYYDQLRRNRVVSFSSLEHAPEPSRWDKPGYGIDLEVALAALSQTERLTLKLNLLEGRTANEIGERLGMPRGTVLSQISRARKKLRKSLGEEMGFSERDVA
ncbi:RNA polymerase sigma factor [Pelagicoccus albus]|uniref:RNA polymerase sigma factor n=1 Tax=Pelagicoccus albus TaxID=415222 RepID=A0A7X1E7C1_9BACT|nr:RNA polymerase sigma factor [Pelagicoccus albus]MBC2605031.1 RNA polymerase sigma factor [Pelagicoccus albus]